MSDQAEEESSQLMDPTSSSAESSHEESNGGSNFFGSESEEDTNNTDNDGAKEASKKELADFLGKFKRPKSDKAKKRRKLIKSAFIDDEAELSGDDEVSEDEVENSDDDENDLDLIDKDAPELNSDDEEEVRKLYQKQLETEDRRAVLLLQEQFEDNDVGIGQRRRRKFRWQAKEFMENSLRRHYDPDDDDSQDFEDEDGDDYDFDAINTRLRRPTAEALLIGSTKLMTKRNDDESPIASTSGMHTSSSKSNLGPSLGDDSNSATMSMRPASSSNSRAQPVDMHRYVFRDKELVQALSTKETVVVSREIKDKNIQREVQRMIQSKSIFDSLYS